MTRLRRVPLRGQDRRSVWRRGVARKLLAAALLGAAVYAGTTALAPAPPDPGPVVVVAGGDIAVGEELTAESVRTVRMPAELIPDGALSEVDQVDGAVVAAPLRAGEVLTDVRLSPEGLLTGLAPDLVLAHLPLVDPDLAGVLHPGSRVDILATLDGTVLAADVLVVQRVEGVDQGLSFLVAVSADRAGRLAAASGGDLPGQGLTVVIRQ